MAPLRPGYTLLVFCLGASPILALEPFWVCYENICLIYEAVIVPIGYVKIYKQYSAKLNTATNY